MESTSDWVKSMRLMIGCEERPVLLVDVDTNYDPNDFDFYVINGDWDGQYRNGFISILGCPGGYFTSLEKHKILTDNQHRLRGNYEIVFDNFHNEAYVAPSYAKKYQSVDIDDDIPF